MMKTACARAVVLAASLGMLFVSWAPRAIAQQQEPSSAGTTSSSPDVTDQAAPNSAATAKNSPDQRRTQGSTAPKNDRLFGVIPNYTTVENEDEFGPLSAKGKFKMAADSDFDPYTFPFVGFVALIGQAENSEPSYGQGLKGYAKRYGTEYGDATIGTTMTVAVFPTLLRQDPRYFQLGQGSIMHRTEYAISRIFVTRSDAGSKQFNASEIAGNLVAAGISNAYHPQEDRTFANTLSVWGTDIMWDTVSNVAKEFWPDIKRKLWKKSGD